MWRLCVCVCVCEKDYYENLSLFSLISLIDCKIRDPKIEMRFSRIEAPLVWRIRDRLL
jgi:hypothetical protein